MRLSGGRGGWLGIAEACWRKWGLCLRRGRGREAEALESKAWEEVGGQAQEGTEVVVVE